jgi:pyridoxine 5-phosphate synthase
VEFHTGAYCEAWLAGNASAARSELDRLAKAARLAGEAGIEVHAGHGLDFDTAVDLCALPEIRELNIGHFLIGEAVFLGLPEVIRRMREAIAKGVARRPPAQQAAQRQQ